MFGSSVRLHMVCIHPKNFCPKSSSFKQYHFMGDFSQMKSEFTRMNFDFTNLKLNFLRMNPFSFI